MIEVRPYNESDAPALAGIYYHTIHTICAKDYTKEQCEAWAPESSLEIHNWIEKWHKLLPFVATINNQPVGFAEFDIKTGHIDCFYVHHCHQREGIGSALLATIFNSAKRHNIKHIDAEVSLTAVNFFKKNGFSIIAPQTVTLHGIPLDNFVMEYHTP